MKSKINLIVLLFCLLISASSIAQSTAKPIVTKMLDNNFLKKLSSQATALKSVDFKNFSANEKSFVQLIQTATSATKWGKAAYITFKRKATSIIKAAGITGEPDDGGEVFGEPDDGGEVFVSNKALIKYLITIQTKYKL